MSSTSRVQFQLLSTVTIRNATLTPQIPYCIPSRTEQDGVIGLRVAVTILTVLVNHFKTEHGNIFKSVPKQPCTFSTTGLISSQHVKNGSFIRRFRDVALFMKIQIRLFGKAVTSTCFSLCTLFPDAFCVCLFYSMARPLPHAAVAVHSVPDVGCLRVSLFPPARP